VCHSRSEAVRSQTFQVKTIEIFPAAPLIDNSPCPSSPTRMSDIGRARAKMMALMVTVIMTTKTPMVIMMRAATAMMAMTAMMFMMATMVALAVMTVTVVTATTVMVMVAFMVVIKRSGKR